MAADLELVEKRGGSEIETQKLGKAIEEFNLPEDQNLLIGWTQERFADASKHFFLGGLGLIKLHMTTMGSYSEIIQQNFPGINERTAWNYMAVAKAMINHPVFQAFQKERGGYSKILTVISICGEVALDEADETGKIYDLEMKELAKRSVRTTQKMLLRAREKALSDQRKATKNLSEENAELRAENEDLKVQVKAVETPADAAFALVKQAEGKLLAGFQMLNKVPKALLVESPALRDVIYGLCGLVDRVMKNQEWRADEGNIEMIARDREQSDEG